MRAFGVRVPSVQIFLIRNDCFAMWLTYLLIF